MFEYCVQALRMSEAEVYLRIRAGRLGREFPGVFGDAGFGPGSPER